MHRCRVGIIGAGVAGLAAAMELASAGCEVRVFERAERAGGKLREIGAGDARMDAGPTVFTLRCVFENLFAAAGADLARELPLHEAEILARHTWMDGGRLDLFSDPQRSADAVAGLCGGAEAQAFLKFSARAADVYRTLERSFIGAPRPGMLDLVRRAHLPALLRIHPFTTLAAELGKQFRDPRLRQLFGRYATYCGSSPFASPATLMLIAHVEQRGVWYVDGGMFRLAQAMQRIAERHAARFDFGNEVQQIETAHGRAAAIITAQERWPVDAIVSNADNAALRAGLFGNDARSAVANAGARSLSAVTWHFKAQTRGFTLAHHTVFFQSDYRAEFDDISRRRRLPSAPTVYACAQDRRDTAVQLPADGGPAERIMCLVNAPASGDVHEFNAQEISTCEQAAFRLLKTCGLELRCTSNLAVTTPNDFHRRFPATGGALYGPASHGWKASFTRPGSRSAMPGLYLAGGSTHPGAGLPMAAISGRLAAQSILADFASMSKSRVKAIGGGTSML